MDIRSAYLLARELRKRQTVSEKLLWKLLRNKQFHGLKFYRQHVVRYNAGMLGIKFFVADFCCPSKHVIIELDGEIHQNQKDYDNIRDEILKDKGIRTLRINNSELSDINSTFSKIYSFIFSGT